jgi:acylphosphatase
MHCVRCIVSGRVQGVWFRETTRQRAQALGLTGSAVNLPNGDVEVIACGAERALQQLQDWLWEGSSMSKVTGVDCQGSDEMLPSSFTTG